MVIIFTIRFTILFVEVIRSERYSTLGAPKAFRMPGFAHRIDLFALKCSQFNNNNNYFLDL
jgi:hypothetical protein